MLMTESVLRKIIQDVILIESQENIKGTVSNQIDSSEDMVKDFPMSFISQIKDAVDQDLEGTQPLGDESVLGLAAGATLAAPIIFKGLKWMSIQIAKALQATGFDVGVTKDDNIAVFVLHKLEKMSHDLFETAFEAIGKQVLRLFIDEPTPEQVHTAAQVVKFIVLIGVFIWGFSGLMHALHHHQFWMTCGETIVNCIEYGEIMYVLSVIGAISQGHYDFKKHANSHGIQVPSVATA